MKKVTFALVVGLVVGGTGTWAFLPPRLGNPMSVEVVRVKTTRVGANLMEFGVEGEGWEFAGSGPRIVAFKDKSGPWSSTSCLVPISSGQQLEMGVVRIRPYKDAPSGDFAVWIKCLDEPQKQDFVRIKTPQ